MTFFPNWQSRESLTPASFGLFQFWTSIRKKLEESEKHKRRIFSNNGWTNVWDSPRIIFSLVKLLWADHLTQLLYFQRETKWYHPQERCKAGPPKFDWQRHCNWLLSIESPPEPWRIPGSGAKTEWGPRCGDRHPLTWWDGRWNNQSTEGSGLLKLVREKAGGRDH